jgi:hypothetical protein
MARKFFYVCAGMFLLALSYHLGASTAVAQAPSNPVVAMPDANVAVTANGDLYTAPYVQGPWTLTSNVLGGGPTPALHESWGQLKTRYAPNGGTVSKPADTK